MVVLPYDLEIKQVFPENIKIVTDFAKKTGDYPTLSATDIKVMALTYQLEKELVGTKHLRTEPVIQRSVNVVTKKPMTEASADVTGFYLPKKNQGDDDGECTVSDEEEEFGSDLEYSDGELEETVDDIKKSTKEGGNNVKETSDDIQVEDNLVKTAQGECKQNENSLDDILVPISRKLDELEIEDSEDDEDDNDEGWITPSNIQNAKSRFNSDLVEGKSVKVACITTDFAMQNVLKQLNLNVSALDGRMIRQLRTFILRCYTCFSTTSVMTKKFCPKCGNSTLKRVGVSLDADGKQQIHINGRRPLTARGKKFSLPTMKGGKHSNNPHLVEDQPFPDQRPTRLARMKNNPMEDDYISGEAVW